MIKISRKDLGVPEKKEAPPPPKTVHVVENEKMAEHLERIEQLLSVIGNAVPDMVKRALTDEIKALVPRPKFPVVYTHTVVRHYEPDGPIKTIISTPAKPH